MQNEKGRKKLKITPSEGKYDAVSQKGNLTTELDYHKMFVTLNNLGRNMLMGSSANPGTSESST